MKKVVVISTGILCLLLLACSSSKKTPAKDEVVRIVAPPAVAKGPEPLQAIQVKYGKLLGIAPDSIRNLRLYQFIDEWMGTPYKWGGTTKKGIDCSAFMQRLLLDVYGLNIPRTSEQQFFDQLTDRFKMKKYAFEGDLVFFRTMKGKYISHVGLYLTNNMFVNSSSSGGVSIASLNNPYWKSKYVAAGRIKNSAPPK